MLCWNSNLPLPSSDAPLGEPEEGARRGTVGKAS